jgi:sulfur carrier protein
MRAILLVPPVVAAALSLHGFDVVTGVLQILCNGASRAIACGTTVAGLLDELDLSPRQVAVEVNLELVPRARHAERTLRDGDRLEIVSLVGGG